MTRHPDYRYSTPEIVAHYVMARLTPHEGGPNLEWLIPFS